MLPVVLNPSTEAESPILQRIAISLQYEGSFFCGWQRQTQGRGQSVQAVLEKRLQPSIHTDPLKQSPLEEQTQGSMPQGKWCTLTATVRYQPVDGHQRSTGAFLQASA